MDARETSGFGREVPDADRPGGTTRVRAHDDERGRPVMPSFAQSLRPAREPDFVIGPPDDPYMLRWWLIPRNDVFNVYYHRVLKDDDDRALHDHPWPSYSLILMGRLREHMADGSTRLLWEGSSVYRPAEFAHRLELVSPMPAETLFITGPKVREWGFHCPQGWRHWKDFVGSDRGQIGRGCGEADL